MRALNVQCPACAQPAGTPCLDLAVTAVAYRHPHAARVQRASKSGDNLRPWRTTRPAAPVRITRGGRTRVVSQRAVRSKGETT